MREEDDREEAEKVDEKGEDESDEDGQDDAGDALVREEDRTDRANGGEVEDTVSVSKKNGLGSGGERREADGCGNEDLLALDGGDKTVGAIDACGWGGDGEVSDKEDRRSVCDARGEGGRASLRVISRWSEDAESARGMGDEDEDNDTLIKRGEVLNEDGDEEGDGE